MIKDTITLWHKSIINLQEDLMIHVQWRKIHCLFDKNIGFSPLIEWQGQIQY